ncbi:hypothetical protein MHYP_G00304390 [Metynnis hypsauchen]
MDQEPEAKKSLDVVQRILPPIRGARCVLPPIKGRAPVIAWAATPEALFSARLLGNETPEPDVVKEFPVTAEHEREEGQSEIEEVSSDAGEETVCGDSKGLKILTVSPTVFKRIAEEFVRRLESVHGAVPLTFSFYKNLVDSLIEEVESLGEIKVTDQVLDGRLFPDENEAVCYIVSEAWGALLNKKYCVDRLTIRCITNTIMITFVDYTLAWLSESGSSPDTDSIAERLQSSPEVEEDSERGAKSATSLSCSTVLGELEICGGSLDFSDNKCSDKCSEFSLKDTGTKDATTTGTKKKRPLRSRISRFLRRLFCCGCISSRHVVPI